MLNHNMHDRTGPRNGKPSICFVAPNAYGVLSGREDIQHIGGAEVQQALIARELVRRGYRVSFVTYDHGQPDGIEHDGIRVIKMCARCDGVAVLRFVYPRWTSLARAMKRARSDIYYQRTAAVESGQVALWCQWKRRGFILAIAKPPECDRRLGSMPQRRERWLYYYALQHADVVVAQTSTQRRMLAENFAIKATVVRSCAAVPQSYFEPSTLVQRLKAKRILWIGRFNEVKRPDLLATLAEQCPDLQFDVIGRSNSPNAATWTVLDRLRSLGNVTLHGFLSRSRTNALLERSALLVCTSVWEGFPNTFLEAWSRGLPTVSTVDPDDVIRIHRLGFVASTIRELSNGVYSLLRSPQSWSECSRRAKEYFRQYHTVNVAGDAYESLLAKWQTANQRACTSVEPT